MKKLKTPLMFLLVALMIAGIAVCTWFIVTVGHVVFRFILSLS